MIKTNINFPTKLGSPGMYDLIHYPGGETQLRLKNMPQGEVTVSARIKTDSDIIQLALLASAIKGCTEVGQIILKLPYFPYARADRRFTFGDCNGLLTFKDLLCSMGFDSIETLDIHNPEPLEYSISAGYIINKSAESLINRALSDFSTTITADPSVITVLLPDKGAYDRYIEIIPRCIGNNLRTYGVRIEFAEKERDPITGKLLSFKVPTLEDLGKNVLIVDDICDGGGTFNGIAAAVNNQFPKDQTYDLNLGLYVTHGIFSQGFTELGKNFKSIHTTNSVSEHPFDGAGYRSTWKVYDAFVQ